MCIDRQHDRQADRQTDRWMCLTATLSPSAGHRAVMISEYYYLIILTIYSDDDIVISTKKIEKKYRESVVL